ncbi:hypothetical protein [Pseudomonas sp. TTU2014-080ASC]|uniref:hypothetical protein n=1 Tax=Pseudomonas sp. TTU2014-080ASC TaxID=1729724 RepID=UPI00071857A8|nr:hypothetical protein [Pseudomonas sp. TTU2014-080ASC]KRW62076.1 hypothetical protein AO726_01250 [Pseudomonas sp. TTU2014-080ASC]
MEWNDVLKEVSVRFKYRSWLLIDVPRDDLPLNRLIRNVANDYRQVSLVLDCGLEDVFSIVDALGPGVSYAASLQAVRSEVEAVVAGLPQEVTHQGGITHPFRLTSVTI